jgi:hypothetical protein
MLVIFSARQLLSPGAFSPGDLIERQLCVFRLQLPFQIEHRDFKSRGSACGVVVMLRESPRLGNMRHVRATPPIPPTS